MPRAKRLAIIEDNNQDDTPQISNLLQNIRSTQHKLLKGIFKDILLLPAGTPIKCLIETFDKLVYSEILNSPINKIFNSIDNVNQRFDKLLTDFKNASQASGLAETYKPLCEGLELFIQWYRIQSIEVFLYKPLASEFAIKEDTLEEKVSLQDRFDILIKKINYFNSQVEEIEQGQQYYKPPALDMKVTDLREMLQPLLVEESRLSTLPNQAKVLEKLEQERLILVRNLDDLQQEMERDISACEASLVKAKEKREKLYDSALGIDVYYVDEFKKKYKETFESYKKTITSNKQRDEFLRVEAIEKLIQHFSDCFRKFELSLNEYYSIHISTLYYTISSYLYHWVSSYYYSVNGIYELLTQQFSAFKLNSAMLRLEAQYHEQYEYLRIGLPEVKKIVEESFVRAGKEYLREVEASDEPNKAWVSSQAKDAFDNDVLNQTLMIRPSKLIPTIKSLTSKALKRDKLNKNWSEIFHHIFTKELQEIKLEFDVLAGQSTSDLALLKKMESRLRIKRQALDAILDNNQYPDVCDMLDSIYLETNLNPIILGIRDRIKDLEKPILPTEKEQKSLPISVITIPVQPFIKPVLTVSPPTDSSVREQQSNPEGGSSRLATSTTPAMASLVSNPSPWYASFTNKTWKRAVLFGLLTFVLVILASTIWGLAVEMTAGAIVMGGLGFGGIGFSLTAGAYYASQKCCCNKAPPTSCEPVPSTLSCHRKSTFSAPSRHSEPAAFSGEAIQNNGLRLFDHKPVVEMTNPLLRKPDQQSRRI